MADLVFPMLEMLIWGNSLYTGNLITNFILIFHTSIIMIDFILTVLVALYTPVFQFINK
jgi:hypothetical protein